MKIPVSIEEFYKDVLEETGLEDLCYKKTPVMQGIKPFFSVLNSKTEFTNDVKDSINSSLNIEARPLLHGLSNLFINYGIDKPIIPNLNYKQSLKEYLRIVCINNLSRISGWFTKLPYQERKYLMFVNKLGNCIEDIPDMQFFPISCIPNDVKIEGGVPSTGQLYIAHPYRTGVYLPVSKYESLIFRERVHELSKVMMALGATEIRTIRNSGYKSQSNYESSTRTSSTVSYGGKFDFGGGRTTGSQYGIENEKEDAIVINFRNDPLQNPHIPQGLIWYPHDREWQQIADNRLNGNLLEYEINISSKEVNLISNSERSNIEAQARVLLVSGSFSRETSSSSIFKEESAKSTSILIKFKSRKDY